MTGSSWVITFVGWLSILFGLAAVWLGLMWFAAIFGGGGGPLAGAVWYLLLTMVAGPILLLGGAFAIYSSFKFMGGHTWARNVLEIFWWVPAIATAGNLVYESQNRRYIEQDDILQRLVYLVLTTAPAIVMILLLRSEAIRRSLSR